ncbi:MAG: hypothetical protein IPJ40_20615 [Saprospirales bacterium]|nr:hypothetical protein [Saprospirales bacterium]
MKKLNHLLIGATFLVGLYGSPSFAQSTPAPGDIVFTHASSDGNDICEFITLKRLDLSGLALTDRSFCASGKFFDNNSNTTENVTPAGFFSSLTDVPAGTYVRVSNATGSNETATGDGLVTLYGHSLEIASNGDQFILYTGAPTVTTTTGGCPGAHTHVLLAGINVANTNWRTTGNPSPTTSYAPGTPSDYDTGNPDNNRINPTPLILGNAAAIRTACITVGNWQGSDNPADYTSFALKNIQFNESNYTSGSIPYSTTSTTATVNLSGLVFSGATADTRYMVFVHPGTAPNAPADRYTCYSGINTDITLAPDVVSSFTYDNTNPCLGPSTGNGKLVFSDCNLSSSLTISGLTSGGTYYLSVCPQWEWVFLQYEYQPCYPGHRNGTPGYLDLFRCPAPGQDGSAHLVHRLRIQQRRLRHRAQR